MIFYILMMIILQKDTMIYLLCYRLRGTMNRAHSKEKAKKISQITRVGEPDHPHPNPLPSRARE